jgi:arsenite methyltransferase
MIKCLVYETDAVRHVTGDAIHPGGLALTRRAVMLRSLPAGARVLDVGCGAGASISHLADLGVPHAFGIDASTLLLQAARQANPAISLTHARGERAPFAAGSFDAVIAECTLSLMNDTRSTLGEFARLLKPGGSLIATDMYARQPAALPLLRQLPLGCCLQGAVSRDSLEEMLPECGFSINLWEDHTQELKTLAARLIFAHGSMENFWRSVMSSEANGQYIDIHHAVTQSKPGYFLLLATRT